MRGTRRCCGLGAVGRLGCRRRVALFGQEVGAQGAPDLRARGAQRWPQSRAILQIPPCRGRLRELTTYVRVWQNSNWESRRGAGRVVGGRAVRMGKRVRGWRLRLGWGRGRGRGWCEWEGGRVSGIFGRYHAHPRRMEPSGAGVGELAEYLAGFSPTLGRIEPSGVGVGELAEYLAGFSRTLSVVGVPAGVGGLTLSAGGTAAALPGRPDGFTGPVRPHTRQHQPTSPRRSFATTSCRRFRAQVCVSPVAGREVRQLSATARREISIFGSRRLARPFYANSATFVQPL